MVVERFRVDQLLLEGKFSDHFRREHLELLTFLFFGAFFLFLLSFLRLFPFIALALVLELLSKR